MGDGLIQLVKLSAALGQLTLCDNYLFKTALMRESQPRWAGHMHHTAYSCQVRWGACRQLTSQAQVSGDADLTFSLALAGS